MYTGVAHGSLGLNDNQYFYAYLYSGKSPCVSCLKMPKIFSPFTCIMLQITKKK